MQNGRQIDLSTQVERVKRKTRPWKSIIALLLAIAAAVISHQARRRHLHHERSGQPVHQLRRSRAVPRLRVQRNLRPGREIERAARADGRPGAFRHRPVRHLDRRRVHHAGDHARAVRCRRQPARPRRGDHHRVPQHRGTAGARQRIRRAGAGLRPAVQGGRRDPAPGRRARRHARRHRDRYRDHLRPLRHRRQRDVHPQLAGAQRRGRSRSRPSRRIPRWSRTASRARQAARSSRSRARPDPHNGALDRTKGRLASQPALRHVDRCGGRLSAKGATRLQPNGIPRRQ